MELITVRYALDISLPEEKQHIVAWFRSILISKGTHAFPNSIDPNLDLSEERTLSSIITVVELSDYYSSKEPNQRPYMSHVVYVLSSLAGVWKPTKCTDPQDSDEINYRMTLAEMMKRWNVVEGMSSLGNWNSTLGTNDDIKTTITN
ncbi:receptor-like kinase TMK3 [Primulina eburnea]|uniref:receptor-like kinase TMK3 n=1 Tax=Primulina eburnea TaxID=1245227 RepID=UPI003C6C4443